MSRSQQTWAEILEGLRQENPLGLLPHAASYDRFLQHSALQEGKGYPALPATGLKGLLAEALGDPIRLGDPMSSVRVLGYRISDPHASEDAARKGRGDFVRLIELQLEVGSEGERPRTIKSPLGLIPALTDRGTLIRKGRKGRPVEWAPLAQAVLAPGVHFSEKEGKRVIRLQPRFGAALKLVGGSSKKGGREEVRMGPDRLDPSQLLTLLHPVEADPPRKRKGPRPPLPFLPNLVWTLGVEGREDLNRQLGVSRSERYLTHEDLEAAQEILRNRWPGPDDVNHLARYRVLLLGDYLEQAARGTLAKFLRRLASWKGEDDLWISMPRDMAGAIWRLWKDRCEYLEDRNPLAALAAARKVTFYGPGGLSREAPLLDRRDLHRSHYGRLCAVETPEAEGIGMDLFLATYATIDEQGRILTLLASSQEGREVAPGEEEGGYAVAHEGVETEGLPTRSLAGPNEAGQFLARKGVSPEGQPDEVVEWIQPDSVAYRDVYPGQFLGPSASLIPFLAHDDGARALMAAKNMKQATPLLHPESPWVKTGFERLIAEASGWVVRSRVSGEVVQVALETQPRIVIQEDEGEVPHPLPFPRAGNSGIPLAPRPRVAVGDRVEAGAILAEGPAITGGELALGRNLLVAYLPWEGFNFEDAVVVSERMVKQDVLTSLHVEEVTLPVWRGGLLESEGPRGEDDRNLDHDGLIRMGAPVRPGTVLARMAGREVVAWPGLEGTVVKVEEVRLRPDAHPRYPEKLIRLQILAERKLAVGDKLMGRHGNKGVVSLILPEAKMPHMEDGTPVDLILNPHGVVSRMNLGQLLETHLGLIACRTHQTFTLPPFQAVEEAWLESALERWGFPEGKATLIDPRTGRPFPARVTVGYQYILKLHHLAAEKVAVRAKGPRYHLITQQAVRGRRAKGGQRFGEMEAWALQAYQAPYLLRELFTLKADDVAGRQALGGDQDLPPHLPESFRALIVYLRGLVLEVELYRHEEAQPRSLRTPAIEAEKAERAEEEPHPTPGEPGPPTPVAIEAEGVEAVGIRPTRTEEMVCGSQEVRDSSRDPYVKRRQEVQYRCDRCEAAYSEAEWQQRKERAERKQRRQGGEKRPVRIPCAQGRCKGAIRRRGKGEAYLPKPGGLLDQAIFGEPHSAEYRNRFGHILLAGAVAHPWWIRIPQSPLSKCLKISGEKLTEVVHGRKYVTLDAGETGWKIGELISPQQAAQARREKTGTSLQSGPAALRALLQVKGLEEPPGAFLSCLPVIPPAFRPYEKGPQGNPISPLHRAYVRVLERNKKLQQALQRDPGPSTEKEVLQATVLLQRAVEDLLGFPGGPGGSLSDLLTGKEGILRLHLLGKRVDYSGRAVIVPDPALPLDQVGLPRAMFDELTSSLPEGEREDPLVLANRAPSLHRMSLQAFHAVPHTKGEVIALHPLVCGGFNADFDGDTMAVHLILTPEARREAERMLPSRNLLSITHGHLTLHLTQDIVAGVYLGTRAGVDPLNHLDPGPPWIEGSGPIGKDGLVSALERVAKTDPQRAARLAQAVMRYGFQEATRSGLTFSLFDVPLTDRPMRRQVGEMMRQAFEGPEERREARMREAWGRLTDPLKQRAQEDPPNPVAVIFTSKARGSPEQLAQLGGMRGLMERPGGRGPFPIPLESNFREGLGPIEYFVSLHGTRKSLADKKLQTPVAGNLTRTLVEACYPVVIVEGGCFERAERLPQGITVTPLEGEKELPRRLVGRILAGQIGEFPAGTVITEEIAEKLRKGKSNAIPIRSPLTCLEPEGICQACYGVDLSTGQPPTPGLAIGIIAGESIGERGTQLSMRTFHTGGVAGTGISLDRADRLLHNLPVPVAQKADPDRSPMHPWNTQAQENGLRGPLSPGGEGWSKGAFSDQWQAWLAQARAHQEGKTPPTWEGGEGVAERSLGKVFQEIEGDRQALYSVFLAEMRRIYKGDIDDRHFEVVLRRMLSLGELQGIEQVARKAPRHFLARASFKQAIEVLAKAAWEGKREALTGYKERMMIGRLVHEGEKKDGSSGERKPAVEGKGETQNKREAPK